jgi:ATP-dependent DNA helicase RecG
LFVGQQVFGSADKDVGEGPNTALAAMRSLKLKAPVISENHGSVRVSITPEKLASPEEIILDYQDNNKAISNSGVRALSGISSKNTAMRILRRS